MAHILRSWGAGLNPRSLIVVLDLNKSINPRFIPARSLKILRVD
jgi:hypothetical protein